DLVGLVRELGHAFDVGVRDRLARAAHVQAGKKVLEAAGTLARAGALLLLAVAVSAQTVLGRPGDRREVAAAIEIAHIREHGRTELRHRGLGQLAANPRALERVVVDEYEAVEPDADRRGNAAQ